jgi:hypothetical protein
VSSHDIKGADEAGTCTMEATKGTKVVGIAGARLGYRRPESLPTTTGWLNRLVDVSIDLFFVIL